MSDALSALSLLLREQLLAAAVAAPHLELYVLVDPTLGDTLQDVPTHADRMPLPIRYRELNAEQRPYLLRLGDFGRDDAIERSVSLAVAEAMSASRERPPVRSICGWLQGGIASAASHLIWPLTRCCLGATGPACFAFGIRE